MRDEDRVDVYDAARFTRLASIAADKPSGIFLTARANRTGSDHAWDGADDDGCSTIFSAISR